MPNGRDLRSWRGLIPRELRDKVGCCSVICGMFVAAIFEFLYVFPAYIDNFSPEFYWHVAFVTFLLFNFYGNLYKLMSVDASGRSSDLPSILKPEWKYCYICHLNAPPRAYHCTQCDECILKRDHHCIFAGCCVGFHNHRYYLVALIYFTIFSQYAIWWHWSYLWSSLGGFSLSTIWYIFFPQFALILMQIGFGQFFLACIMMFSICSVVGSMYFLIPQLILIVRGQTQHEYLQNISVYDLGFMLNIQSILGTRWYVTWLLPWIESPLPGDGLKFPDKKNLERPKDF